MDNPIFFLTLFDLFAQIQSTEYAKEWMAIKLFSC